MYHTTFNPIALKMARMPQGFSHSENHRVNKHYFDSHAFSLHTLTAVITTVNAPFLFNDDLILHCCGPSSEFPFWINSNFHGKCTDILLKLLCPV